MTAPATAQAQLLASARLRLSEGLVRRTPEADAIILRAAGRDERLVISPAQADLLENGFSGYKTVPEVLVRAIAENRCPPLREFYELVLQAHAAGILVSESVSPPKSAEIGWRVRFPTRGAIVLGRAVALGSAIVLAWRMAHWTGPADWRDVLAGWLAACALLSLGQLLAACAIAACGEVRAVGLHWRTRFPHFRIDTGEAMMGGRACEVAVAALRVAPILCGAATATWLAPGWLAALSGASLFVLAPFGRSAARQWLAARRKQPPYSVRTAYLFQPVRADPWMRWTARSRAFFAEFGWAGVAWSVVWAAWLGLTFTRCMPKTAAMIRAWLTGVPPPVQLGAEYLLLGLIAVGFLIGAMAAAKHWFMQRAWAKPLRGADARDPRRPALTGNRAAMLAEVPLFHGLDDAARAAVGDAMEVVECPRREVIIREDEPGDDFYLIVEGEVEVRKRLPGRRRSATIGWLGPGDCFGEIALLEKTTRTATLVASRPARLLRLARADFDRLIVARIGADSIREVLQHARFLGRFTFTVGWPFAELIKFARRCRRVQVDADTALVSQGEPNHWFYLIYDGAFEARDGKRVLRRMGPGDYFGEISLLEGWPATATVVALEESRCLALSRADFIEMFARDFRLGLRIEAQAEQRLGAGLFASR